MPFSASSDNNVGWKNVCKDSLFTPSTRWSEGITGPLQHSATSNITRFQRKNKFKIFVLKDTDFKYCEYHNTFRVMISRDVCPVFMSVNNVLTASSTSLNFFSATLRISNSSQLQCQLTYNLLQLTRKDKKSTSRKWGKPFKRRNTKELAWCLTCVVLFCLFVCCCCCCCCCCLTEEISPRNTPLQLLMSRNNLVPRVFSFSNMAATGEKIQKSFSMVNTLVPC